MEGKVDLDSFNLNQIGLSNFKQKFPWIGGDLQTIRDSFSFLDKLPKDNSEIIKVPIPSLKSRPNSSGYLLTKLDLPMDSNKIYALIIVVHGLGGSSERHGLKRLSYSLLNSGFATLRVNLRGALPGRRLAPGSYAAECNSDILKVISKAREICNYLSINSNFKNDYVPLYGVGISLGGTILLNACMDQNQSNIPSDSNKILDALVCTSSPLDLASCSASIQRPRNSFYQKWLLRRLVNQTLLDPFGVSRREFDCLSGGLYGHKKINSIRDFDAIITAPRWGYEDVDQYYENASPIRNILKRRHLLPQILFLQSLDDPWVPAEKTKELLKKNLYSFKSRVDVVITNKGGHNGFHGYKGCWSDSLVNNWLKLICN